MLNHYTLILINFWYIKDQYPIHLNNSHMSCYPTVAHSYWPDIFRLFRLTIIDLNLDDFLSVTTEREHKYHFIYSLN